MNTHKNIKKFIFRRKVHYLVRRSFHMPTMFYTDNVIDLVMLLNNEPEQENYRYENHGLVLDRMHITFTL